MRNNWAKVIWSIDDQRQIAIGSLIIKLLNDLSDRE